MPDRTPRSHPAVAMIAELAARLARRAAVARAQVRVCTDPRDTGRCERFEAEATDLEEAAAAVRGLADALGPGRANEPPLGGQGS